jgi:DNA mismatch repair protein MutS
LYPARRDPVSIIDKYREVKKLYPDTVLLFRIGDFYEAFDDDAKIVSETCDIVLCSRPIGPNKRVPMAGVPYHAVNHYVGKLLNAGYKVGVADGVAAEIPVTVAR